MVWFWAILLAGLTVIGLLYALGKFERESVNIVVEELKTLKQDIESLRQRVENLEIIAAEEDDQPPKLPDEHTRTSVESPTQGTLKTREKT